MNNAPTTETRKTTADGIAIYRVPESNMPNLETRIAKLNKRADKLKMDPLVLSEIGEEFETRTVKGENDHGYNAWDATDEFGNNIGHTPKSTRTIQLRFVLVTLTGNCPRVNGWAMAATIQHDENGNILRTVPGFETTLPMKYRTAETGCDHCHTNRIRKDTYVLQSESGGWKQVGRNCLADFLRSENAGAIAEMAELLAGLDGEMEAFESEEGFAGHATHYFQAVDLPL